MKRDFKNTSWNQYTVSKQSRKVILVHPGAISRQSSAKAHPIFQTR